MSRPAEEGGSETSQVVIRRKPYGDEKVGEVRVGTWNVRTLNRTGKLDNCKKEMARAGINILSISEVRWKGCGDFMSDGVTMGLE